MIQDDYHVKGGEMKKKIKAEVNEFVEKKILGKIETRIEY